MQAKDYFPKIFVLVTFLAMLFVNGLANALPINGMGTGEISDLYPNLFTPAGITFAVWGLIYVCLAVHILFQLGLFRSKREKLPQAVFNKISFIFGISSLVNVSWIFAWHYKVVWLSVILIVILLILLIRISQILNNEKLIFREELFIKAPFGVYFGWITVATIANITAFLVSIGWDGFGISEQIWTIIILIVGTIISLLTLSKFKCPAYQIIVIWAYTGILIKHLSENGFSGAYKGIIITVTICLVAMVIITSIIGTKKILNLKKEE